MLQPLPNKKKKERKKIDKAILGSQQEEKAVSAPLISPDPALPIAIICDIDGTLAHRCDRGVFDFEKSIDDTVCHQLKYMLDLIYDQNREVGIKEKKMHIIILTGREQMFAGVTNRWLNRHGIPFDHVYMRRSGDHRKSNIVKSEIYASVIRGKYNILFAIDDRQQDIDMWRELGIYCIEADNTREQRVAK